MMCDLLYWSNDVTIFPRYEHTKRCTWWAYDFSVGRLAGCRSPFTESTLTALSVRIRKCGYLKNKKKSRPSENTPRNPHQPSERDHLETARETPRPTRQPMLTRFHIYRIRGNGPRTGLAISKIDECYTFTRRLIE